MSGPAHRTAVASLGIVAWVACSSGLPTEPITAAGDYERSVEIDDQARSYDVHVPAGLDLGQPAPLLIAFHGAPSNAAEMREMSELDAIAAAEGFVVVYPEASRTGDWNHSCRDCSGAGALEYDDVKLTEMIIEKMALDMRIDIDRVYAMGFSQGALMTFRVACDLSHRVAAVATVGATMLSWQGDHCGPSRAVPIAMVHGTEDEEFPPEGRIGALVRSVSVEEMVTHWVAADGCDGTPVTVDLPDVADDGTTVSLDTHAGCSGGAEVRFYRVQGGGHTWPGSSFDFSPLLGVTSQDLAASATLAEFLLGFTLRAGVA
jgi:polyhydroxybutyrate depolymerase